LLIKEYNMPSASALVIFWGILLKPRNFSRLLQQLFWAFTWSVISSATPSRQGWFHRLRNGHIQILQIHLPIVPYEWWCKSDHLLQNLMLYTHTSNSSLPWPSNSVGYLKWTANILTSVLSQISSILRLVSRSLYYFFTTIHLWLLVLALQSLNRFFTFF
jgi:hypothetical protein